MQEKISNNAILFITRLKSALNFNTDLELAEYLGIKQNTLSTWKSRNSIDYNLIISKCDNISFDYLNSGKGEMFLNKETKQSSILSEPIKSYIKTTKDCEKCKEKEEYINILKDTISTQKKLIVTIENILLQHNISIYKVNQTEEEETHTPQKNRQDNQANIYRNSLLYIHKANHSLHYQKRNINKHTQQTTAY